MMTKWRESRHFRMIMALIWIVVILLLVSISQATTGLSQPQRVSALFDKPRSPQTLNTPSNIACLPFPEPSITEYNGNKMSGPYTSDTDQTFITWRDESDSEDEYIVDRRLGNGNWVEIATLPADSMSYTDTGLEDHDDYYYRVRARENNSYSSWSDVCRKPAFVNSSNGNFRVFYRPHFPDCPNVEDLDGTSHAMCSDQSTAQRMADELEASYAWITTDWIANTSFPDPIPSPPLAADISLCDGNGCARDGQFIAMKPSTMAIEFDLATATGETSLRVPRHELFHIAQKGVTYGGDVKWMNEGTARSTDDKYCLDEPTCNLTLDTYPGSWYVGDAGDFLANPNRPLFESGYDAALFWTYISEQYGNINTEPERGVDFFVQLWESGNANAHTHGRQVIDFALDDMGYSENFVDVFKDFVVANYAKDIANAPAKYKYIDESQPPGSYGSVALTDDETLSVGEQYILADELKFVSSWGARYFRFVPVSGVPTVAVESETFTGNDAYFTLLAVKNGSIVEEINVTGDTFAATVANDNLDEVVLVVAGLEQSSNISLAVNATEPELRIVDPISSRPAQAGDPATPEKILIKVEVLSPEGGGTPIAGIDLDSFEVSVGGVAVPDNQFINTAYIQGEYWLLVRAPSQPGTGSYPLVVENNTAVAGAALSDSENGAVIYGSAIESDNLIVGDRSGSMQDFGKIEAAQDAARLYVDSWEEGDQIGVLSYNEGATVDLGLRPWTGDSRDDAFQEINDWDAVGGTGIGVALLLALDEFDDEGDTSHPWNVIVLSDGMETVDEPNLEDFIDEYDARKADSEPVPQVFAVALGADADQAAMQQLACDAGDCANYHFAGEPTGSRDMLMSEEQLPNELGEIYRIVAETIALEQQIYAAQGTLLPQQFPSHSIQVDGSAKEAVFVVNYVQVGVTQFVIQLRDPNGMLVQPTFIDGGGHRVYRVPLPMPGEWEMSLAYQPPGVTRVVEEVHYLVEASLRSDLTMDVFLGLAPQERMTGTPMPILVSLSDTQPLTGASVTAEVTNPLGSTYNLTFHDDGLHGDGSAGDGFYGTTFYHTSQPGTYQLVVDGEGTSPLHGDFSRRVRTSFYMDGGKDTDGDGLPDRWEEDHGLDPTVPDSDASDPDGDNLTTHNEFFIGTHPLDPDTDNGGENDGSEYFAGRIPQDYPADDGILPPTGVGWPGAGQLWLTFDNPPRVASFDIWRRNVSQGGAYILVAENLPPTLQWRDANVSNGMTYCYRLMAVGLNGAESGSTDETCVTPRIDPISPDGSLAIAGNTSTTQSTAVQLILSATDAPSDQHHTENEEIPAQGEGAQISGVSEMMIANGRSFAGAAWEPYKQSKQWILQPDGRDMATVCVKYRDAAGNVSEPFCQSILINDGAGKIFLPIVFR